MVFVTSIWAKTPIHTLRTAVRQGDVSRIVIEASERPEYNIFYLSNPNRIVIDLLDADISGVKRESSGAGAIREVRAGVMPDHPRIARFVADLAEPGAVANHFVLAPMDAYKNFRIVIDVEKSQEEAFKSLIAARKSHASEKFDYPYAAVAGGTKKDEVVVSTPAPKPPSVVAAAKPSGGKKVIVIDPGHGGHDPGTIGKMGTKEKDIVLAVGKSLRDILTRNPNYKVLMTRETDVFIPLRERAAFGERNGAALFLSIHADSSPRRAAQGFSNYTLNARATDEESAKIAEKENAADLLGVGTFDQYDAVTKNILGELMQTQVKIASVDIAAEIVRQMKRSITCLDRPQKEAPFTVLRSTIPSVLNEIGFLSNDVEEKLLRTKAHRDKIAAALGRAIDNVLKD
jgi:N-acetylmuramoyl-L-alanine amidase